MAVAQASGYPQATAGYPQAQAVAVPQVQGAPGDVPMGTAVPQAGQPPMAMAQAVAVPL